MTYPALLLKDIHFPHLGNGLPAQFVHPGLVGHVADMGEDLPPIFCTVLFASSRAGPFKTPRVTRQPPATNLFAVAKPMPIAPPVITAHFAFRSTMPSFSFTTSKILMILTYSA